MSKRPGIVTIKAKSPAKINIGLRVLSKRKDGFHNLETIFYPVKIFDEITIDLKTLPSPSKRNIISVITNSGNNISGKKNICFKAAELFLDKFVDVKKYNVTIKIKKNIPMGAGLGGGSSDAASVLTTLAKHFKIKNNSILNNLALKLGSDVPFFLLGKPAYASGRGEKLITLPEIKIKGKLLIVNPGIHVSTPWAFKQLGIQKRRTKILNKINKFNINDERLMINDFERVVFKRYPKIEKIKYDMYKLGASYSLMSGSGSTVYGLFSASKIKDAEKCFLTKGYRVFNT